MQIPEAQSALVAVDPKDGAVVALVGGFDFFQSKFNRVTQARRQPGSGFKPFVYAAAFDKGYTPASIVVDAPIVVDETGMEKAWRPREFENDFAGPIRLREALVHSRNLVSIRLMREIGGDYTWNYVQRFGFDKSQLPNDLTLAARHGRTQSAASRHRLLDLRQRRLSRHALLHRSNRGRGRQDAGAGEPVRGVLRMRAPRPDPAGGQEPAPRTRLLDEAPRDGKSLIPAKDLAPQVIRPQVAYLLSDMMADVIRRGTGVGARVLNRDDLAGKTGTTNDFHDAWFSGFNGDLAATVWTGFDQDRSLGEGEQGARAALPIWVYFMHQALAGAPRRMWPMPDGLVTVRISPDTGLLASADNPNGIMEKFIEGNLPKSEVYEGPNNTNSLNDGDKPLF